MIEGLFDSLYELLYGSFWLANISSFIWGILSIILSPCHLSSIPLIIGFLSSQGEISTKRTFNLSLMFSVGILVTIALIGVITLAMGRLMGDIGTIGNYVVAVVFFVVGLYLLDVITLPWDGVAMKGTKLKGLPAAFVLGLIFGIGLGPCAFAFMAPILGVVFAVSGEDIVLASSLLISFSIGHIFLIVLAGTLTKKVQDYLNWTESSNATKYIKKFCGILVILAGFYLIFTTI